MGLLSKKYFGLFLTVSTLLLANPALSQESKELQDATKRVQNIFETSYAEKCRSLMADEMKAPNRPKIRLLWFNYGDENYPERPYRVYQYLCFEGPYNQGFIYYGVDEYFEIYPLSFAVPNFEIIREIDDYTSAVKEIKVVGFTSTDMITNASYDEDTNTIYSFAKWTGPAETFSTGKWGFEEGSFVLHTFDVDAEWDGRRLAQRIYGEGTINSNIVEE